MYVIYIYNKNKELLTEFFEISNLSITEKLNDVSTASFQVPNKKNDLAKYKFLKEWNIVDIYKVLPNSIEKRLFYGLIKWVKSDLQTCEVRCVNFLYLLKKKVLFYNENSSEFPKSPKELLEKIAERVNQRDPNFIKKINCDLTEKWTWQFKIWKSVFDILKDFASDLYEFKFVDWEIFLLDTIWKNRTTWKDIVFFEYNIFSPESSNIAKAEIEYDLDNIFNYVSASDWVWFDVESVENFWVLEKVDEKNLKEKLLLENKNSLKEFKIEPSVSDFFLCDVWDTVKVFIDNWTEMLKFNWNLKVVEKSFKSGDLENVTFKLNSSKFRTKNIFETISDLKNDVKNLKL